MAHPIDNILNRIEGVKPVICSADCDHFKFPHLDRACVLSDVFSVLKGEPCFNFKSKITLAGKGGKTV